MKHFKFYLAQAIARILEALQSVPGDLPIRRILLVNRFGIGDVLLSASAIQAFRTRFPDAHLAMWVRKDTSGVLEGNPYLDEIVTTDFSFLNPARHFDLAVLLVYHPFQTLAVRAIPYKAGYLHSHRVQTNSIPVVDACWDGGHLAQLSATVARALGCEIPDGCRQIFLDPRDQQRVAGLVPQEPFLAVNLQTKIPSKSWPLSRMKEVLSWSPIPVVLVGGQTDVQVAKQIENEYPSVTNLTGRLTLRQTAAVLERCQAFLTADSGPMHLGFAVGAPTVAIFGYTDPRQIYLPAPQRRLLHHSRPCAPHFKVGSKDKQYEPCPSGDCMKAVSVEEVKTALLDLYQWERLPATAGGT